MWGLRQGSYYIIFDRVFDLNDVYIRLFEKLSGRLIANKLTDENGFYEFDHLTKIKLFIVAHHPASQFNAIIQDNVVPK